MRSLRQDGGETWVVLWRQVRAWVVVVMTTVTPTLRRTAADMHLLLLMLLPVYIVCVCVCVCVQDARGTLQCMCSRGQTRVVTPQISFLSVVEAGLFSVIIVVVVAAVFANVYVL